MSSSYDSAYWAAQKYRDQLHVDLRDGAIAGILGGGSIMILFLFHDMLLFKPLSTPNLLAQILIGREGLASDLADRLRFVQIGMFTVLHLSAFLLLGIALAKFFRITKIRKTLLSGGIYGLIACTGLFGVSLRLSGIEVAYEPRWLVVLLLNFVAGAIMAGYLRTRTPKQQDE